MKAVVAFLFVMVLVGSTCTGTAVSHGTTGLTTSWPIELMGYTTLNDEVGSFWTGDEGAITQTRIQAETIRIDVTWERGIEIYSGGSILKRVIDQGKDTISISDVQIALSSPSGTPIVFADRGQGQMEANAELSGSTRFVPGADEVVVAIGDGPRAVGGETQESPQFWHETTPDLAKVQGTGTVSLHGSFLVFVHDLTLHAKGSDRDWSGWTGYHEDDPEATMKEYEFRVTTIKVQNGSMVSGSSDNMELYLQQTVARLDGRLNTLGVTGEVVHGGQRHVFNKDSLNLEGSGIINLRNLPSVGSLPSRLHIDPEGDFQLTGASGIETARGPGPAGVFQHVKGVVGGVLSLFALAGMVALGIVPGPTRTMRRRQSDLWRRRGRQALDRDAWTWAASCYAWSTFLARDDALAWFERAQAELERNRPDFAERWARHAMTLPGMDRSDLLDLRAIAAWELGDREAFYEHLTALAQEAPLLAEVLLRDLGLPRSEWPVLTPAGFNSAGEREVLDGYG